MAATNIQETNQSPAAHRKSRKTDKVNLRASQNDEITVVGIGASADGVKALQQFFGILLSKTGMEVNSQAGNGTDVIIEVPYQPRDIKL